MGAYLNDTLAETPRVIEVGQAILDEMAGAGGGLGRTFMLGVLEDLNGEITVGTSGSQAGDVGEAVRRLNAVHAKVAAARAKVEAGASLGSRDREDLDTADPAGATIGALPMDGPDLGEFDRYRYRARNDPAADPDVAHHRRVSASRPGRISGLDRQLVILEHVNCAAPQLLANRLKAATAPGLAVAAPGSGVARLDAGKLTEILWDKGPTGVMIGPVRYHHRQRVPSCDRCVNNLRIVVAKALRDSLREEIEWGAIGLSSVATLPRHGHEPSHVKAVRRQRRKEVRFNAFRAEQLGLLGPALAKVVSAEDELSRPNTHDLVNLHVVPVRLAALRELDVARVAVHNEQIGFAAFEHEVLPPVRGDAVAAMVTAQLRAVRNLRTASRKPGRPTPVIVRAIKHLETITSVVPKP